MLFPLSTEKKRLPWPVQDILRLRSGLLFGFLATAMTALPTMEKRKRGKRQLASASAYAAPAADMLSFTWRKLSTGNLTWLQYGNSGFWIGKSSTNGGFSIAILIDQRVSTSDKPCLKKKVSGGLCFGVPSNLLQAVHLGFTLPKNCMKDDTASFPEKSPQKSSSNLPEFLGTVPRWPRYPPSPPLAQ